MPNTQTPYGPVDTEALRCLQDSLDIREILRIVDLVDTIRKPIVRARRYSRRLTPITWHDPYGSQ